MIQKLQLRVNPRTAASMGEIVRHLDKYNDIPAQSIQGIRILKRSIDARQRNVVVNLKVSVYIDEPMTQDYLVPPIEYKPVDGKRQAIVVGMGPGGLFAALRLIELGIKPVVLERGKDVMKRRMDASRIQREGIVDPESNYCFGEGGAGAYSDGKLYTRSKSAVRSTVSWASLSNTARARTSSSTPIPTSAVTSCLVSSRQCARPSCAVGERCTSRPV